MSGWDLLAALVVYILVREIVFRAWRSRARFIEAVKALEKASR